MEQLRPEVAETTVIPTHTAFIAEPALTENLPPKPQTHTREFSIGEMKEEPAKIKIDFVANDNPNDFIKAPSQNANVPPTTQGAATYINPLSTGSGNNPLNPGKSKEEIQGSVRTLVAIIDYVLSIAIHIVAKEGTQSQYTAETTQKRLLENALTDYFYEKQIKMSAGFALFMAFLGAYGFTFGKAIMKGIEIRKAEKKGITPKKESTIKPVEETYNRGSLTAEDIQKMQATTPLPPPIYKPQMETIYVEKNGIAEEKQMPKWLNPDPKIIAKNKKELEAYILEGIYPMFLKNINNNNHRKVKYNVQTGKPIYIGKPARLK